MPNPLLTLRNKLRSLVDNFYFDNWPVALLQRGPFHKENLVVYRKGKITFLVDFAGGDASGTRHCLTSAMYTQYFAHLDRARPLIVLDLGANGGGFPLSLLAAGFTFSRLVCVEMNRNTCTRLAFNLHYNIPGGAVALHAAVAGRTGTVTLPDTRGGTNESIDDEVPSDGQAGNQVPLLTLDDIVRDQFGLDESGLIDVCKIDIERAEYDLFFSETCQAIRRTRYIIIEIHPHKTLSATSLIEKISSFGFERLSGELLEGGTSVYLFKNTQVRS